MLKTRGFRLQNTSACIQQRLSVRKLLLAAKNKQSLMVCINLLTRLGLGLGLELGLRLVVCIRALLEIYYFTFKVG